MPALLAVATLAATADDNDPADRAKQRLAQSLGRAASELSVVGMAVVQGGAQINYKVRDASGTVHAIEVPAEGQPDGTAGGGAPVAGARPDLSGKLEPALAERLSRTTAEAKNVVVWLRQTDVALPRLPASPGERSARWRAEDQQLRALRRPLIEHIGKLGQRLIYEAQYAPVVVVAADDEAVRALAARPDVEKIYIERVHRPRLDVSRPAVQADLVEARGIDGRGVRVAIIEAERIGSHPNLPVSRRITCRPGASALISYHKTEVAGIIQSNNGTWRGIAPGITLIDGIGRDFSDAEMMAATDCAIAQGAVALNMSFGSDTDGTFDAFARYVDTIAYARRVTPVVAISNACELRMGSPEIAFNALAVGSFSDRNTLPFADDRPGCNPVIDVPHSAYRDPPSPHMDREEPDVVAPGHYIRSTVAGGGFQDDSGTSFAAPHVVGGIASLVQRRPELASQPERVRAVLMAAASHNIEGANRLSERDGAGAILLAAADRVLFTGQSWSVSKPGGTAGFPVVQSFFAQAGEVVRIVVVWAHKMPLGNAATQPTSDLDLVVKGPKQRVVGTSATFDNTFEIVQFTATVSSTYTAKISNTRSSTGAEYIGIAVSRRNM